LKKKRQSAGVGGQNCQYGASLAAAGFPALSRELIWYVLHASTMQL
jgi:hypothetical protein